MATDDKAASLTVRAYDLALVPDALERTSPDCHGWCFGLPPGITTEQWPLDPANGYPLQHGFTLLLPDDYRCHGPEIVAVSFFASAVDLNDGGPMEEAPDIRTAMAGKAVPDDPDLLPFWHAERAAHPRLHRMEDILGTAYAAVLLMRSEFEGSLCSPPRLNGNSYLDRLPPPVGWRWVRERRSGRAPIRPPLSCPWSNTAFTACSAASRSRTCPGAAPCAGRRGIAIRMRAENV